MSRLCAARLACAALIAVSGGCRNFGDPDVTPPTLSVSPSSLTFSGPADGGSPPARALTIDQLGTGALAWTAESDVPWLSISPAADTAPSVAWVSVSTVGMGEGSYSGTICVTSADTSSRVEVPVTLVLARWYALSLTGRWVGATEGVHLALTLVDSNGVVTGWGNLYSPLRLVTVTGTFQSPAASLTLTGQDSTVITFSGLLAGDNAILGTLDGGGLSGVPIYIFRQ